MSHDKELLHSAMKAAMRRLAGSVFVVSPGDGETKHAMSATAVTSLSMAPAVVVGVRQSRRSFSRRHVGRRAVLHQHLEC